jgi:hypothetical protein
MMKKLVVKKATKNPAKEKAMKVVKAIQSGWKDERICKSYGVSKSSLASYKGNYTRGTYKSHA